MRPNAYTWKLLGEREVLAPLNATLPGWPDEPDRNYGPSGLSVATDRWDLRYAVVIEGVARRRTDEVAAVQLWIDWQTQQPLYFISKRDNGLLLDIGILVHRFSSDRAGYPDWPGGGRAHVFDPVAAVVLLRAERRQRLAPRVLRRALAPDATRRPPQVHVDRHADPPGALAESGRGGVRPLPSPRLERVVDPEEDLVALADHREAVLDRRLVGVPAEALSRRCAISLIGIGRSCSRP